MPTLIPHKDFWTNKQLDDMKELCRVHNKEWGEMFRSVVDIGIECKKTPTMNLSELMRQLQREEQDGRKHRR